MLTLYLGLMYRHHVIAEWSASGRLLTLERGLRYSRHFHEGIRSRRSPQRQCNIEGRDPAARRPTYQTRTMGTPFPQPRTSSAGLVIVQTMLLVAGSPVPLFTGTRQVLTSSHCKLGTQEGFGRAGSSHQAEARGHGVPHPRAPIFRSIVARTALQVCQVSRSGRSASLPHLSAAEAQGPILSYNVIKLHLYLGFTARRIRLRVFCSIVCILSAHWLRELVGSVKPRARIVPPALTSLRGPTRAAH